MFSFQFAVIPSIGFPIRRLRDLARVLSLRITFALYELLSEVCTSRLLYLYIVTVLESTVDNRTRASYSRTTEDIGHRMWQNNFRNWLIFQLYWNVKVKIYKTIILSFVVYGCETWCLTLREQHSLRVFERVRAWVNPCGIWGWQSGTGTCFSPEFFGFIPVSVYHSTVALQTHIIWGMRNMLT
jgi:hypothetical protein